MLHFVRPAKKGMLTAPPPIFLPVTGKSANQSSPDTRSVSPSTSGWVTPSDRSDGFFEPPPVPTIPSVNIQSFFDFGVAYSFQKSPFLPEK